MPAAMRHTIPMVEYTRMGVLGGGLSLGRLTICMRARAPKPKPIKIKTNITGNIRTFRVD
ncbi:hypothetical protein D9M72_598390 [compost metagenome]